jgi:hypothetical protein
MFERRSKLRSSRKQIFLVVGLALLIYIILMGRQGVARDVVLDDGIAYVAVGVHGGIRVLNIIDPTFPFEVGYFNTPGGAYRVAIDHPFLYVADGRRGMRVLEVSDPTMPVAVGVLNAPGDIRHVIISGDYAYLAAGNAGLVIADISNPTRPIIVSSIDTPGFAQAIALVYAPDPLTEMLTNDNDLHQRRPTHALLADGNRGLLVFDIRLPISPVLVTRYDPPGDVQDVAVSGQVAVIASGRGGVRLLDITNPVLPAEFVIFETSAEAQSVAIYGSTVIVAEGDQGIRFVDFVDPSRPTDIASFSLPGSALRVTTHNGYLFVSQDVQGVRITDLSQPFDPDRTVIYETPGDASFLQVGRGLGLVAMGRWGEVSTKVWRTMLGMGFDLVLFFTVLAFWLFIFAQFVLPVKTLGERWQATSRMITYFFGRHGPAIFIENGDIRQNIHEKTRRGPGVALLDTASGAVMRSAHAFTRPVGPGIVFTGAGEYPEDAVDLHRQVRSLGFLDGEDPFAPQYEGEPLEVYQERQRRRYNTSALTRDGVEVVPTITTVFSLIGEPGAGRSAFGYNPQSVWRAIARKGVNPDAPSDSEIRSIDWKWLPVYIAADLWRDYLRKFTLNELFELSAVETAEVNNGQRSTAFDVILTQVRVRMTKPEVAELDEIGTPTGGMKPSKEYEFLRERGIQVIGVSIHSLRLPPTVEDQLVDQWKASWLERAVDERKEMERLLAFERMRGEESAAKAFASYAGQMIDEAVEKRTSLSMPEAVEALVEGTLRLTIREPELNPRLTTQKNGLVELIEWIRKL